MRKFGSLVILFILIATLAFSVNTAVAQIEKNTPCAQPIHYQIAEVDKRFGLTADQLITKTKKAADIWNKAYGKTLFVFDPTGALTVNMVFDERQLTNNQINQLQNQTKQQQANIKPQIAEYQKASADFKTKLADLNSQIAYWNSRGGAPENEYNKLIQVQKDLQSDAQNLNQMARELNQSEDQYNADVNNLNSTIGTFNEELSQKPEEGIYKGGENKIEVYFYNNDNELVHTLAHELGHSVGLQHNENPKSIMYPQTTKTLTPSTDDLSALQTLCNSQQAQLVQKWQSIKQTVGIGTK